METVKVIHALIYHVTPRKTCNLVLCLEDFFIIYIKQFRVRNVFRCLLLAGL